MMPTMRYPLLLLLLTALTLPESLFAEGWNQSNNPELMAASGSFEKNPLKLDYKLSKLPTKAKIQKLPWSDSYWPSFKGGLAHRYKIDTVATQTVPRERLLSFSEEKIALLSPAEKYDIYCGRYNYPLTKSELQRTDEIRRTPEGSEWEGLCHGWAPAAVNFEEPKCVTLTNSDGLKIPFGSSDIKGLLTYFQGEVCSGSECSAGARSEDVYPTIVDKSAFNDINPGAFHLILTNLIKSGQGFVSDRTSDRQVWNQPVFGYEYTIKSENNKPSYNNRAPATVKEVTVEMRVDWVAEVGASDQAYSGTEKEKESIAFSNYNYVLELDASGNIIGGRWLGNSKKEHPDFIWMKGVSKFSADANWKPLEKIYKASIK
ncbi:MAG: hypothetical protein HQK52_21285 [Oligoflexia bacterium]|nr:hypothetical protein [Oligoflexia bacterium]